MKNFHIRQQRRVSTPASERLHGRLQLVDAGLNFSSLFRRQLDGWNTGTGLLCQQAHAQYEAYCWKAAVEFE